MAVDIGPKIGIEGESEFRRQIKNVNEQIKTLGSEMKVVETAFEGQEKSEEALTAKSKVLTDEIGKQREKIDLLTKGLQESAEKYGENDDRTLKWKQAVNGATAELSRMENELGKTTAELKDEGTEAGNAGDQTKKAGQDAKDSASDWSALGNVVAGVGAAMAAAAAAAGAAIVGAAKALTDFAVGGAAYADELNTMSAVTGLSTEKLQELAYAADLVDVSVDTITGSMKKNLASMVKVRKGNKDLAAAYASLGVSVLDANGNLRDDEEVYWELIAALGTVEDETQRDVLAMELLGKSATDLNPLIMAGADTMAELATEAHNAGYVLSAEALDAFSAFDDQLTKLGLGAAAAKNALGTVLLPVLTDLAGEGVDLLGQFTNGILDANGDISKMGEVVGEVLPKVLELILGYVPDLITLAGTIITSLATALTEGDNLQKIMDAASTLFTTLLQAVLDLLPTLLPVAVETVLTLAQDLLDPQNIQKMIDTGISLLLTLIQGLTDTLPELIPLAVNAIITLVDALTDPDNLMLLLDAAIELVLALTESIIDNLPKLAERAPEIVLRLGEAIIEAAPRLLLAALKLIDALIQGLLSPVSFENLYDVGKWLVGSVGTGVNFSVDDAFDWGKDLIKNFVAGIVQNEDLVRAAVGGVGTIIANLIGFSEPKEGPLSSFHEFSLDMMDLFIQGIRDKTGQLHSQLARSFDIEGLMGGALLSGAAAQRQQVVSLDASSLAALQASGGGGETVVSINFTGSLAQLGRLLQPEIQTATRLRGAALVTG